MRVAFTWYTGPRATEHTQWFDMPQVPAVGDSVSVGDPYVPTMIVRRVLWVPDLGDEHEGCRLGVVGSPPIASHWHAEVSLVEASTTRRP